jgi:chromosome segregation protein
MLNGEDSTQKAFHRLLGAANARPDGYNIVLQGDVTSLAKMTANERRKVLDNVAGVTSYDDEIRKATKQQEKVEGYIERIGLLEKEQLDRLATLEKEKALAEKAKEVTEEIQRSNELLLQSRYASMKNELEFHTGQRDQSIAASQTLMDEHKENEKTLLQLDDRIAELQKEINALTGGDTSELGRAIRDLQVRIELNNDRISEAEREDGEEAVELAEMNAQWSEAKDELSAFQTELKTANDDLASALGDLDDAEKEEEAIKIALESAGEKNLDLSRALSKANENTASKKAALDSAQSDVDRLALEAQLIGEQLATAQDEAEEMRLALGECDLGRKNSRTKRPNMTGKH